MSLDFQRHILGRFGNQQFSFGKIRVSYRVSEFRDILFVQGVQEPQNCGNDKTYPVSNHVPFYM